jgi:hypothetical protein
MLNFSWTCPYCSQHTTITLSDHKVSINDLHIDNADGNLRLTNRFIVCPNPNCKKVAIEVWLNSRTQDDLGNTLTGELLKHWQLIPYSSAKSFPDYIPKVILDDYHEACLIRDLSPKASATLARRCIQGIIRDYWQVKPARLVDEIDAIKDKIDPLVWDGIDTIRKVGNIGAHMEKDINFVVDVEPKEAELLLVLIEMLLKEWYVLREERRLRLEKIVQVGVDKQLEKQSRV